MSVCRGGSVCLEVIHSSNWFTLAPLPATSPPNMVDLDRWLCDQEEEVERIYGDVMGHPTPPGAESSEAYSLLQQFVEDYST